MTAVLEMADQSCTSVVGPLWENTRYLTLNVVVIPRSNPLVHKGISQYIHSIILRYDSSIRTNISIDHIMCTAYRPCCDLSSTPMMHLNLTSISSQETYL